MTRLVYVSFQMLAHLQNLVVLLELEFDIVANAVDEDVKVAETDERFQVSAGPSNGADVL